MLTWTCFLGLALYMFISTAVNGRVIGCPLCSEYMDEWVAGRKGECMKVEANQQRYDGKRGANK